MMELHGGPVAGEGFGVSGERVGVSHLFSSSPFKTDLPTGRVLHLHSPRMMVFSIELIPTTSTWALRFQAPPTWSGTNGSSPVPPDFKRYEF